MGGKILCAKSRLFSIACLSRQRERVFRHGQVLVCMSSLFFFSFFFSPVVVLVWFFFSEEYPVGGGLPIFPIKLV